MVFDSPLPLWQIPRNVYRQAIYSIAELDQHVRPMGPIGAHLAAALDLVVEKAATAGIDLGEAYILGDSPLVLFTALQSPYQPDPSSSQYVIVPAPRLDVEGRYVEHRDGRPIRVHTQIDNRLMLGIWRASSVAPPLEETEAIGLACNLTCVRLPEHPYGPALDARLTGP